MYSSKQIFQNQVLKQLSLDGSTLVKLTIHQIWLLKAGFHGMWCSRMSNNYRWSFVLHYVAW